MSASLLERLMQYAKNPPYPFHMPGHKGGKKGAFVNPFSFDITEIEGFDNLHHAEEILLEAQKKCAKTFGAEESFFMVNGSTGGMIAAILSICQKDDKILIARNCHKSVYSGLTFSGAVPVYVMPEWIEEYSMFGGISPKKIEEAFEKEKTIKAVVITSPTYEGFVSDIEKIAEIVHKNNAVLIVDEAHGAHMKFSNYFPKTALQCGADIVVQSMHKTLPALTQTALLHIQGKRADHQKLKQTLTMVQTSSPSYVFMASMDKCRELLEEEGKALFQTYVCCLKEFRKKIKYLKNTFLVGEEIKKKYEIFDIDLGKLVFINKNLSGQQLQKELLKNYHIQLEMNGFYHALAMTSIADTKEGFLMLYEALEKIEHSIQLKEKLEKKQISFFVPQMKYTPFEAFSKQKEACILKNSVGKICAQSIIAYPPGIPIAVEGEAITDELLCLIKQYQKEEICLMGIEKRNEIQVLK